MKRLFDFQCSDCKMTSEKLVSTNIHSIECECGGKATRVVSMPTIRLDGISGDFPGAANRWASIREERHRVNAKKSYAKP